MAMEFELDMTKLLDAMRKSPEAAGIGAAQALDDIKDDWVREARNIAPIDKSNLRKQIQGDVDGAGMDGIVEVRANATSDTGGKRFNYGYYIHEQDAGGKSLRTSGTVKQFLDESGKKRETQWQKWLEEEVEDALKREGW